MPITVEYGSPTAAGTTALAAGQGQYAERQSDKARQEQAQARQIQAQQQSQQASQYHDIQRMMLGAQIENAQSQENFARNRYAAQDNATIEQTQQKEMAEFQFGLSRQADEAKMTLADRVESERIERDVAAIKAFPGLSDQERTHLLGAASVRDGALRQAVAQRAPKNPIMFPHLPPEQQPGQAPYTLKGLGGQPIMRPDGKPAEFMTNEKGMPEPFYPPWEKAAADQASKDSRNQTLVQQEKQKRQQEQKKNFATFAGKAMEPFIIKDTFGNATGIHPNAAKDIRRLAEELGLSPGSDSNSAGGGGGQQDDVVTSPDGRESLPWSQVPPGAAYRAQDGSLRRKAPPQGPPPVAPQGPPSIGGPGQGGQRPDPFMPNYRIDPNSDPYMPDRMVDPNSDPFMPEYLTDADELPGGEGGDVIQGGRARFNFADEMRGGAGSDDILRGGASFQRPSPGRSTAPPPRPQNPRPDAGQVKTALYWRAAARKSGTPLKQSLRQVLIDAGEDPD